MLFSATNYCVLGIYLLVMVMVGIVFSRRQKTTEDYFLAGRSMPWLPVAMSMYASLTSAVTYMGLPGLAYRSNVTLIVVAVVSPLLAPVLVLVFYPFYRRMQVTTSYEYIGKRFGATAHRSVSGLFLLARMGWLGIVIYAPALALSIATGMPLWLMIVLMGVLATVYTVLGGLAAVLWTDVLQFVVLVGGAIWVAVTLVHIVPGGLSEIMATASAQDHIQLDWHLSLYKMTATAVFISFFFQMMQDYGTDQVTVQRLLAVKTNKGLVKAICFNAVTDGVIIALLLFIGLGIFVFYFTYPGSLPDGMMADGIFPYFIMHQLPNGISGLLVAAIFAAAMSSMDSGLNSVTTVIVNDFVRPLRKRVKSEQQDVALARTITLILGGAATGTALFVANMQGGIVETFATFMSLFNAPVLALFLLGILTRYGRFEAWCVSAVVSVLLTWVLRNFTDVNWVYYFPFSFFTSLGLSLLGSLFFTSKRAVDDSMTLWGRSRLVDREEM